MTTARTSGTYTPAPARGDCRTGKVQYATRKQARRSAKKLAAEKLNVFLCPTCHWFHVGHLPQRVRSGEISKDAWLKTTRRRRRKATK